MGPTEKPAQERGTAERIGASGEGKPSVRLGSYLRRLREGYGYTLRKVEEKSFAIGEPIDNSQLSRFEKGKALPSFDKLRVLARIFNVSVQNFSDVLDLEEFEIHRPATDDYDELLAAGADAFARGDAGRAFVAFEKALEVVENGADLEKVAEARWRMAASLRSLGKLRMTEHELREILRLRDGTARRVRIRALLQLSSVYRELSDLYLAEIVAREGLDLAVEDGDLGAQAAVLNLLGNIRDTERPDQALPYYQRAADVLREAGAQEELLLTVLVNLGGCLIRNHRSEDGLARLSDARTRAGDRGYRRIAALAATRMAEAYLQRGDHPRAARHLDESDAIAGSTRPPHVDLLFLNTYLRWSTARQEGNGTREKIAFGRLRHLRSLLERRFPEVDEFDRHVERNRRRPHESVS